MYNKHTSNGFAFIGMAMFALIKLQEDSISQLYSHYCCTLSFPKRSWTHVKEVSYLQLHTPNIWLQKYFLYHAFFTHVTLNENFNYLIPNMFDEIDTSITIMTHSIITFKGYKIINYSLIFSRLVKNPLPEHVSDNIIPYYKKYNKKGRIFLTDTLKQVT